MGLSTHWRSARDHVRVWVPHWRIDAPRAGVSRRRHPVLRWTAAIVAVLIVIIVVGSFFINEPLRRYMESTLNKDLKGYSVRLPGLVFNPLLGFKITFKGLTIIQNQHPQPPVAKFTAISARVQGGGLLHGRLVAVNFEIGRASCRERV